MRHTQRIGTNMEGYIKLMVAPGEKSKTTFIRGRKTRQSLDQTWKFINLPSYKHVVQNIYSEGSVM